MAYTASLGAEFNHEWEGGIISRGANLDQAYEDFRETIGQLMDTFDTEYVKIALTGTTNFRKDILPAYKSKRGVKPICLQPLKDKIVAEFDGVIKPGLEADDVV